MRYKYFFYLIALAFISITSCDKEPQEVMATSVSMDKTIIDLPIGQTVQLSATVLPETTTNKLVEWASSDETVACVSNGLVTTYKLGKAIITATCGMKSAKCTINVIPVDVESITLDKTSASLKAGETVTLTATVNPSDATDKTVTWSTSDATVATVSNGVVTAVKVGSATITAKAGDKTATCAITVKPTVQGDIEPVTEEDW